MYESLTLLMYESMQMQSCMFVPYFCLKMLTFLQHAEMADESVQLKTLQTILIIFQSRLHPESEVSIVYASLFS